MEKELIYLICPVRNVKPDEKEFLDSYVDRMEKANCQVHYPPRDVNQIDDTGLRILCEHREVMKKVSSVHCYWNNSSSGSFFDFGMAYMAKKTPWQIINPENIKNNPEDFERFVLTNATMTNVASNPKTREINNEMDAYRTLLSNCENVGVEFNKIDKQFLFQFGMAFFAEKPIIVTNIEYLATQKTPSKSFQNVLIELDARYRKAL